MLSSTARPAISLLRQSKTIAAQSLPSEQCTFVMSGDPYAPGVSAALFKGLEQDHQGAGAENYERP